MKEFMSEVTYLSHMELSWATCKSHSDPAAGVQCLLECYEWTTCVVLGERWKADKWAVSWEILIPSHLPRRGRRVGNRAGHTGPFLPFLSVGHASFQLHCESCRKGEARASEMPIAQRNRSRSGISITWPLYAVIWCHLHVPNLSLR